MKKIIVNFNWVAKRLYLLIVVFLIFILAYNQVYILGAEESFYIDGNGGVSNPNGVWSNDNNAFDGDPDTTASTSSTGSKTSNYLQGLGSNATDLNGEITSVRARIAWGTGTFSSYDTLDEPSGGWTWAKVQGLEARVWMIQEFGPASEVIVAEIYEAGDAGGTALSRNESEFAILDISIVELEVTYTEEGGGEEPAVSKPRINKGGKVRVNKGGRIEL